MLSALKLLRKRGEPLQTRSRQEFDPSVEQPAYRRLALPAQCQNLLRRWVAAQEELDAAEQARQSMIVPMAEFVPLQLDTAEATAPQNIVIEVRRGSAIITLR